MLTDILTLATDVCGIPMAVVTSYADGNLHVEYQRGIAARLATNFCSYAIIQDTLLEVPDATRDARFCDLPEVRGRPFIRFYAGIPLISSCGTRLGTLALLDSQPRTLDDKQRARIHILAHQVTLHLELRRERAELEKMAAQLNRANARLREQAEHLKQAQFIARVGSWKYLINEDRLELSDAILSMYGLAPGEFGGTMKAFIDLVHPEDRNAVRMAKAAVVSDGSGRVECRVVRKNGEVRHFEIIAQLFHNQAGEPYFTGTTQDITEKKETEDRIRQLAYYDQLTGLPNRQFVLDRIDRVVAMRRRMTHDAAVLFIDLDNFKTLNDTHGHETGDLLLRQVAQRLQACVRHYDCVGRFGGDEFVVLLEHIGDSAIDGATHALHVTQKILAALNKPYVLGTLRHLTTPSIGIALIDGEMPTTAELLKRADMAMYKAKAEGRNTFRFFNPQMQEAVTLRARLEADLRQAVAERAFHLHYQPQVDHAGHIHGVEALLRWTHPQRGDVSPTEFIPVAEELGLIMEIGTWVLLEACQQLVYWSGNAATRDLELSINVSARQFHHPTFVQQITDALAWTGANPDKLKIELTESIMISNFDDTRHKMMALKAAGVQFALDDFGTGYSSLAYLQRLPLDQLKIDQSFVHHLVGNKNGAAITRSIIALAHNLGLSVIAEGVETEEQRQFLANEGCVDFQGYLYHRPLPAHMVEAHVGAAADLYQGPIALHPEGMPVTPAGKSRGSVKCP
jgi:diguanylate cyclase (GGDEF)-like protein/PAS domain S-box-containing protein